MRSGSVGQDEAQAVVRLPRQRVLQSPPADDRSSHEPLVPMGNYYIAASKVTSARLLRGTTRARTLRKSRKRLADEPLERMDGSTSIHTTLLMRWTTMRQRPGMGATMKRTNQTTWTLRTTKKTKRKTPHQKKSLKASSSICDILRVPHSLPVNGALTGKIRRRRFRQSKIVHLETGSLLPGHRMGRRRRLLLGRRHNCLSCPRLNQHRNTLWHLHSLLLSLPPPLRPHRRPNLALILSQKKERKCSPLQKPKILHRC
jgi:hypothetical protein